MEPVTTKRKNSRKKTNVFLNVAVIVAIVGCIGSVGAALFGTEPFAGFLVTILSRLTDSTPTPQATLPDTTVESASPVVTQTEVETSPIVVLSPADDWVNNCISKEIWKPYLGGGFVNSPASDCYELFSYGITAEDSRLIFVSNKSQNRAIEHGIFTPWQNWKQVDFSVQYKDLENSEIWVGFFEEDDINSKGIVFAIQPGDDVDVRELPRQDYPVDNTHLPFADGNFNVSITLSGGKMKFVVDGQGIISDWPVNFTIHNLFVGYRSLPNTLVDASVYNLNLIK